MNKSAAREFVLERRLRETDPGLHRLFTDTVFALQNYLSRYRLMFPEYSDHSNLHSLTVIDFCNRLMGDQAERLNADELFSLLMACYLHDSGMGITMDMFREFSAKTDFGDYFDSHRRDDYPSIIRDYHHEFSGMFIRKFAGLFDIPSEAHVEAIVQIARGHRKTDLMDEAEYPAALPMPNGNTVCLPYLAALIRLADEIDVTAERNPSLLFDIGSLTDEKQIMINRMILAIKKMDMTESGFTLYADDSDPEVLERLQQMRDKMQWTLDYCRSVARQRTTYEITQTQVRMEVVHPAESV